MSNQKKLTPIDGIPVIATSVAITGAGDGLSKALATAPQEIHPGDLVNVVIECEMGALRFDPAVKGDYSNLIRKHLLKAGLATIVDRELVDEVLEAQKVANEKLDGIERLDFDDEDED